MDLQGLEAARTIMLAADTVAVWRIPLAQPPEVIARCRAVLTPGEWERADRFRFEPPRRRFTVTRAALRHLLGSVLDLEPAAVELATGAHGKPFLPAAPELYFNVSHSHDEALCAITRLGTVGVDIEHIRPLDDAAAIARSKFAPEEYAAWSSLPESQRLAAFFACWSRKEAFIKATGEGLGRSLQDFVVTLQPGEPPRLLAIRSTPDEVMEWTFLPIPAPDDYATALLVRGQPTSTVLATWVPEVLGAKGQGQAPPDADDEGHRP